MHQKNLKKYKKLMKYYLIHKKEKHMTNLVMLHLNKVQVVLEDTVIMEIMVDSLQKVLDLMI